MASPVSPSSKGSEMTLLNKEAILKSVAAIRNLPEYEQVGFKSATFVTPRSGAGHLVH